MGHGDSLASMESRQVPPCIGQETYRLFNITMMQVFGNKLLLLNVVSRFFQRPLQHALHEEEQTFLRSGQLVQCHR